MGVDTGFEYIYIYTGFYNGNKETKSDGMTRSSIESYNAAAFGFGYYSLYYSIETVDTDTNTLGQIITSNNCNLTSILNADIIGFATWKYTDLSDGDPGRNAPYSKVFFIPINYSPADISQIANTSKTWLMIPVYESTEQQVTTVSFNGNTIIDISTQDDVYPWEIPADKTIINKRGHKITGLGLMSSIKWLNHE